MPEIEKEWKIVHPDHVGTNYFWIRPDGHGEGLVFDHYFGFIKQNGAGG
jgi:hypothetical protein